MSHVNILGSPPEGERLDTLEKFYQAGMAICKEGNIPIVTEGHSMYPMVESNKLVQIPPIGQGLRPENLKGGQIVAAMLDSGKTIVKVLDAYVSTFVDGKPAHVLYLRGVNQAVSQDYIITVKDGDLHLQVYPVILSPYSYVTPEVVTEGSKPEVIDALAKRILEEGKINNE